MLLVRHIFTRLAHNQTLLIVRFFVFISLYLYSSQILFAFLSFMRKKIDLVFPHGNEYLVC